MNPLSANNRLKVTFLLLWLFCHFYQVLSYEVIEKCEEGCNNQVNLEENIFDIACNDSCKLQQCRIGCQRWTEAEPTCIQACNDSSNVNTWVLYCVLGCNHALNVYIDKIKLEVGIPSAPFLVADSLTNESIIIEWNSAPYANISYLVQWRYELLGGDWNYYNDTPLNTSRVEIKDLEAYTQYRFRVEWIVLRQYGMTLFSQQSVIISTLPYGVPSSSPTITSLIPISSTQISVSWEPPRFPNGPILSYALFLKEFPNGPIVVKDLPNSHTIDAEINAKNNKSSSVSLHYMFNGLKADNIYKVSIVTRNNFGEGPKVEKNVTTLESDNKNDLNSDISVPELILATNKELIRYEYPIDGEVIFHLNDFSTTAEINGLAVHVEYKYIFVSDTSGLIRRISLKDENIKPVQETISRDRSRKPSLLSVDWLNDKLYILEETKISRCNLDGEYMESVITGFKNRPSDMKVDPYNGFLYWLSKSDSNIASLYRLDLSNIDTNNVLNYNYANRIYQDSSMTTFTVDFLNYRIYLPISREASIYSITIDGNDPTNIRQNSQNKDQLQNIENLLIHNQLFYFINGTEVFTEEFHKESGKYHHNGMQVATNPLVSLCAMDYKSQPYPVPLNPVENVQAVFLDRTAKIFWEKPELIGGKGLGAWQEWSYEVSIKETLSHITVLDKGLTFTHCEAHELNPETEYSIKVRAYSKEGNGSWSQTFHGKTLHQIDRDSRYPFALWSTKEGVLKSDIVGDKVESLVHKMNLNETLINDITWYRDVIFLNGEKDIYIYNITSHSSVTKMQNISSASSIAIDWIAPKLYWSSPSQQMISRSNLDGSHSEPLPIVTLANEIAIDSVMGYIYWATGYSVESSRLNGMNRIKYLETGLFTGKHIMGLSLNLEKNKIFWVVRSYDTTMLYSAQLANRNNFHHISQTITTVGQLSETNIRGPLVYFDDRMFWLREQHNEALISDVEGKNLAFLRGPGLLDINTMAIVDPSLQQIPTGFGSLNEIVVIPHDVKAENIQVIGSWDNFTIVWDRVENVNYGEVFYDLVLEDRHHYTRTMITGNTRYSYPSTSHLPPYSKIKLAIRAFTYWASSKQTITEIFSPMSIPTKPSLPRIFINYERSTYDNSIEKIHAEFRWSAPDLPNGIITGYTVNAWSIQSGQKSTEVENERVFGQSNRIYLSDLKINTTYYFQVQAFTQAGEGPASDIIGTHSSEEHPVPRLLVAKTNSIKMIDIDSYEQKTFTSKAIIPISVAYISKENIMFWVEEDGILKSAHMDGSNVTFIHQMTSPGTGLAVDWISRHLFWSECDLSSPKSTIWSLDLSDPKAKPTQVWTKNNVIIGSIEIEPFSSSLIWSEIFNKNQGVMKMCSISSTIKNCQSNVRLFFQQNNSRTKRALNEMPCNCAAHPIVSNAIAIDRSNYGKPSELLWFDSKYGRIMASDMSGCHCHILFNSTYGFPPTSLTVDNNFIYWSNSTLGNVYKIKKDNSNAQRLSSFKALPNSIHSMQASNEPHLVLSETANGIHGIRALSDHLQPYPNFECLVPMEYHETVKLIDNTANSLTIAIHEVRRPLGCSKTTLASVLYTIFYGKVMPDGYFECGLSLRGCKTLETFNNTITIIGLEPFTNYTIRVAVKNYYTPNNSINLPGPPVNLETAESKPSPPRNVIAKVETPHKILVTWEPPEKPNGDPILYEMRWYSSKDQNWHKAIYTTNPNITRFGDKFFMTMDNIQPALTYFITIRAYSNDGIYYSDSSLVSATTYHLPNDIILEEKSSRVIRVSWTSPNSNSTESEIGQHTMQYIIVGNQKWIDQNSNQTKPSFKYGFTLNNLKPNTEYAFRLLLTYRSTTALLVWPESKRYVFRTLGDAPEVPIMPKIDDIGIGQHIYKVWWPSVSGNGAQNVLYRLYYKVSDKSEDELDENEWISVYNGSESYWLIEGLAMDKQYVFRIEANSEFGSSNYSEESDPFYYPNREILIDTSEADLITISSGIMGAILFVFVVLILFYTIRRRQVQEQKKKALEDDRTHRNATDLELVPWPVLPGHQHHTNALYTNSSLDLGDELVGIPKINGEQISITQFLGSGAFGEVFEGYWHQSDVNGPKVTKVAIKTLGKGRTDEERISFLKEAKLMANFKHPHILQLQGICLDANLNFLILELMEGGDLLKYLRNNRPRGAIPSPLVMDDLISICADVAKGCKYLEDIHFVHRDLAARNCLVSSFDPNTRVVKIGDFGLARDIYKSDYYRKEGEGLLPVRWMAPESLVDGVFTSQSDVWSFGVLLYEVMSLGQQPYQARSNPQVLSYVRDGGVLDRPLNCPDDMFCLMKRCWIYQREDRPTFSDCLETLEEIRKNASSYPMAITSVHNQNYIFSRGFDNPGYDEDERQAGNSSHKMKCHSSCTNSAQTCSSNSTNDTITANYQNNCIKYLELIGNHEECGFTDADGYQIPISKSPLQRSCDKNKLLNTMNQIVVLNSNDSRRVPPTASVRRKQLTDSTRSCSPPPTYSQLFKVNEITLNSDLNVKNGSIERSIDENSSQNRLSSSHETKNCLLVRNDNKESNVMNALSHSSSSSSPISCTSSAGSPTVAAALLKTQSPLGSHPSRTMAEIKYSFNDKGFSQKPIDSQLSDGRQSSNNCYTEDEEEYEDFDTETIAANDLFCNTTYDNQHSLTTKSNGFTDPVLGQINDQSKYAIITRLERKSALPANGSYNYDANSSWC